MSQLQIRNATGICCAILALFVCMAGSGCDRERPATESGTVPDELAAAQASNENSPPSEPATELPTTRNQEQNSTIEAVEGWSIVSESQLTDVESSTLADMGAARAELAQRLMGALTAELAAEGPVSAVQFCSNQAGPIAASVAEETGVAVGRTSFKLRNQDNAPRAWMRPIVTARHDSPVIMRGENGTLAASHPIRANQMCLRCHGGSADIDAEVLAAIEEFYSADEATGFSEGDLRGWFWTEASVATTSP